MTLELKFSRDHLADFPHLNPEPFTLGGVEKVEDSGDHINITIFETRRFSKRAFEYIKVTDLGEQL